MKYTLDWTERKRTTTGKEKLDCTLTDEAGVATHNCTIWADFPGFATIMTGHVVEGDLVPAKDPKYGPTLYPPKIRSATGAFARGGVSKLMDKKAENIEKAQERKAESISFFNSTNSAINLVTHMGIETMGEAELKLKLKIWRDWFLSEFEDWNNQPF